MSTQVDLQDVVARLSQRIGQLVAESAMFEAALDAAHRRIAELEKDDEPKLTAVDAG